MKKEKIKNLDKKWKTRKTFLKRKSNLVKTKLYPVLNLPGMQTGQSRLLPAAKDADYAKQILQLYSEFFFSQLIITKVSYNILILYQKKNKYQKFTAKLKFLKIISHFLFVNNVCVYAL